MYKNNFFQVKKIIELCFYLNGILLDAFSLIMLFCDGVRYMTSRWNVARVEYDSCNTTQRQ